MKKKSISKLKLTKSTIADLDRVKGGIVVLCGCHFTTTNAANNYDIAHTLAQTVCLRTCLQDVHGNCF